MKNQTVAFILCLLLSLNCSIHSLAQNKKMIKTFEDGIENKFKLFDTWVSKGKPIPSYAFDDCETLLKSMKQFDSTYNFTDIKLRLSKYRLYAVKWELDQKQKVLEASDIRRQQIITEQRKEDSIKELNH